MGTRDCTYTCARKRSRVVADGEDRISNLPESVLCHILSRMPTKDAVRTSILSKDWEFKWTSIYNIDLQDSSFSKARVGRFLSFVDRVLHFTCTSQIKSFRLSCKMYDAGHLTTWISALLLHNVQTLEIWNTAYGFFVLPLPHRLFSSSSLTELEIGLPCILRVAGYNYFPNIKCLKFQYPVEIVNEQSPETGELLLYFPVLKEFTIGKCKWSNVKSVKIDAPEMTILQCWPDNRFKNDPMIVISGNKLEKVALSGSMDNIVLSAPSVYYTQFRYDGKGEFLRSQAFQILKGFSGLKQLEVSGDFVEILAALIRSKAGRLPFFDKLQHLDVYNHVTHTALWEILGALPSLQTLVLSISANDADNCEIVESLPSRALSNLKEIRIKGFQGHRCQTQIAKILLENAENLEKLFVHVSEFRPPMRKRRVERIICAIPCRSSSVIVEVIDVKKIKG